MKGMPSFSFTNLLHSNFQRMQKRFGLSPWVLEGENILDIANKTAQALSPEGEAFSLKGKIRDVSLSQHIRHTFLGDGHAIVIAGSTHVTNMEAIPDLTNDNRVAMLVVKTSI